MSDLACTWRALLAAKGLTALAVVTLALGAGANVAVFVVAYSVVLRPLAVADPDRLVVIRTALPGETGFRGTVRLEELEQWRAALWLPASSIESLQIGRTSSLRSFQMVARLAPGVTLGATPERATRQVLRDGLRLAGAGLGLGVSIAVALLAVLAAWFPARRAARIQPLELLRSD